MHTLGTFAIVIPAPLKIPNIIILQFGRIPTILKKSFVIATPFLFSLLYLNGFETGSLLEIVAEREEGGARPQLITT